MKNIFEYGDNECKFERECEQHQSLKIMNKQERYNKIVKRLPILRDIKEEFWDIVYEPQEGDMPKHFDNLPKAERVAIIGLLNDINHLVNSVTMYESWFNNKK